MSWKRLDLPPIYLLATGIAMWALHVWMPGPVLLDWPWRWLGLLPIVAGGGLAVWGERQFVRAGTAVLPFRTPSALVTSGPFAFTRNPMYLGMFASLAGWSLLLGTSTPILPIPVFVWWLRRRFVLREEVFMEQNFGESYRAYKARVRRWL